MWSYEQNFDGLNTGDLNGQDSWSADAAIDVQTSVVAKGTKAVGWLNNIDKIATRNITGVIQGKFHISMRNSVNNANGCWLGLKGNSGVDYCMIIQMASNGQFKIYTGSTQVDLGAYAANTWYDVIIEFDCVTDKFRVSLNNGASFSAWYTHWDSTNLASVDAIKFGSNNATAAGSSYIDDIRPEGGNFFQMF